MKNFVFFLIIVIFFGCSSSKEAKYKSGKSVKIGILAEHTYNHTDFADQSTAGVLAINKLQPYLSNGDKIKFVVVDKKETPKEVQKGLKLFKKKGVVAAFCFFGSTQMHEAAKVFAKNSIPLIATLATNDDIPLLAKNITQVCFNNHRQALIAAHYIKDELLYDKVAVFYHKKSQYSTALANEFRTYFLSLGGKITLYADSNTPEDMKKIKYLKGLNTQIIYSATDAKSVMMIQKNLQKNHIKLPIITSDGFISSIFGIQKTVAIKKFNGIYTTEHYAHNIKKSNLLKAFDEELQSKGYQESSYAYLAYDGYSLLKSALESCKGYKKECINKHLRNSSLIKGVISKFNTIDGETEREVYIDKVENGKLIKKVVVF